MTFKDRMLKEGKWGLDGKIDAMQEEMADRIMKVAMDVLG